MSEKTAKRAYRNVQYNKMESSQYSKRKDRLGRRASDWMHTKPYGLQEKEGKTGEVKGYIEAEKALEILPSAQPEIIRCKDCKHFEYDHPYVIHGVPVLGHEVCNAWGDGCKTDENGYCFLAERRTDDDRNG